MCECTHPVDAPDGLVAVWAGGADAAHARVGEVWKVRVAHRWKRKGKKLQERCKKHKKLSHLEEKKRDPLFGVKEVNCPRSCALV